MIENTPEVKTAVIEFINRNFLMGTSQIKYEENDSLLEKGIVDSTGVLEMVSFIQDRFAVIVEDSELVPENLDSVSNIAAFVARKQQLQRL
ncbi:MAG: acyl carrier protein [Chitinispirillales bacterium]|nr:acyl carrier protein [Chitinispirillales bacterium]